MYNKKSFVVRLLAVIMIVAMIVPMSVSAAMPQTVQPYASAYLDNYSAYVYLPGDGEVRVYFNVQGTGYMDELGALTIELWESSNGSDWDWVETFNHDTTSGMLSYNDNYHSGYVSYDGTAGYYYKAYVGIWGGKDGSGDSRYFWTSVKP